MQKQELLLMQASVQCLQQMFCATVGTELKKESNVKHKHTTEAVPGKFKSKEMNDKGAISYMARIQWSVQKTKGSVY